MIDALLARPLIVVTGKGGVGKSTVAAAIGLAAAARGRRAVVAEVAARDEVPVMMSSPRDDVGPAPFSERGIADGVWHVSIDPQSAMEEYLRDQLPGPLAGTLSSSRAFAVLALATPGMRELLTVGKVWELAQADRRTPGALPYDTVVLDAPATGHGVAILTAPRTFADAARVGPVARQGRTIHEMLADRTQTAIVAVTTPEEMPVNEALGLRGALREGLGQDVCVVVANRVAPGRLSRAEAQRVAAADGIPPAIARAARAGAARSAAQRAQLRRLRRGFVGTHVRTLPQIGVPQLGPDELRRLAAELVS